MKKNLTLKNLKQATDDYIKFFGADISRGDLSDDECAKLVAEMKAKIRKNDK